MDIFTWGSTKKIWEKKGQTWILSFDRPLGSLLSTTQTSAVNGL
jgi:hypothetical protein